MNTPSDLHGLNGGNNQKPQPTGFSNFNWMAMAWQGALKHMSSTLLAQYEDSMVLEGAASLVQQVGSSDQKYYISGNSVITTGWYRISDLINEQSTYASQGTNDGNADASVVQAAIGQAQSELSNRVQIGQQYVTQETNLATSTDPQASNQAGQEMTAINSAMSQWGQLVGSFG